MRYMVEMRLANGSRTFGPQDGIYFAEQLILPSLERCSKLEKEGKIIAGGTMSGTIGIAMIVDAESNQEIDALLTSLPVWPRMETTVIPLSAFADRMTNVSAIVQREKQRETISEAR